MLLKLSYWNFKWSKAKANLGPKKKKKNQKKHNAIAVFKGHFSSVFPFFRLLYKSLCKLEEEIKGKSVVLLVLVLPEASIVCAFVFSPKEPGAVLSRVKLKETDRKDLRAGPRMSRVCQSTWWRCSSTGADCYIHWGRNGKCVFSAFPQFQTQHGWSPWQLLSGGGRDGSVGKAPDAKPADLRLMPGTQWKEGNSKLFSDFRMHTHITKQTCSWSG